MGGGVASVAPFDAGANRVRRGWRSQAGGYSGTLPLLLRPPAMPAPEWYLPMRHAHLALVATSVGLFALRGAAMLAGSRWPVHPALRVGSVVIDTLLFAAGATLWWILGLDPLVHHWLAAKLAWLVAYVLVGAVALRYARTAPARALAYLAALASAAMMAATAVAHDPAGPFVSDFSGLLSARFGL